MAMKSHIMGVLRECTRLGNLDDGDGLRRVLAGLWHRSSAPRRVGQQRDAASRWDALVWGVERDMGQIWILCTGSWVDDMMVDGLMGMEWAMEFAFPSSASFQQDAVEMALKGPESLVETDISLGLTWPEPCHPKDLDIWCLLPWETDGEDLEGFDFDAQLSSCQCQAFEMPQLYLACWCSRTSNKLDSPRPKHKRGLLLPLPISYLTAWSRAMRKKR